MDAYNIIITPEENYSALVIMCNSNAPLQYLGTIEEDLIKMNFSGKILIDQILHVGNGDERFISLHLDQDRIKKSSIKFVRVSKKSIYRKLSCDFLKERKFVESSILSSVEKKMIKKGFVI